MIRIIDLNDVEFDMVQYSNDDLLIKARFKKHKFQNCDYNSKVFCRKSICIILIDQKNIKYLLKITPLFDTIKDIKNIEFKDSDYLKIICMKDLPIKWPSLFEKKEILANFIMDKFDSLSSQSMQEGSNFNENNEIESPKSIAYEMSQRDCRYATENFTTYNQHEEQFMQNYWPRKGDMRLRNIPQFISPNILAPSLNQLGYTGLDNLGNTCFMNAVLQCLSNTDEFRDFFLDNNFENSLNKENPFGSKGVVAIGFFNIVSQLWSGNHRSYSPDKFKDFLSNKMNKFEGNAQEDSVEFMEIFLDLLHEDLNRVDRTQKIIVDPLPKDEDEMIDSELAIAMWQRHLKYNDSLVVDLFHGQLKSKLTCTVCKKNSITFDPFLFLPVPLPKPQITYSVFYFSLDYSNKPLKVSVTSNQDVKCSSLIQQICDKFKVKANCLRLMATNGSKDKLISEDEQINQYDNCDLFIFQLKDEQDCNEPVYNFFIEQYRFTNTAKNYLEYSTTDSDYWSLNDWYIDQITSPFCFRLGKSFIISLTESELNYDNLKLAIKNRSRHSIDINLFEIKIEEEKENSKQQVPIESTNSLESQESNAESSEFSLMDDSTIEIKVRPFKVGSKVVKSVRKIETITEMNSDKYFDIIRPHPTDTWQSLNEKSDFDSFVDSLSSDLNQLYVQWKDDRDSNYRLRVNSKDLDHSANYYELLNQNNDKNVNTLDDCLTMFTDQEELSLNDCWHCPKCKKPQKANKQLTIWRLSKILIIQLKRFSYKQSTRDKIDNHIEFPLYNLDLKNYCSESIRNELEGKTTYNLYAVINHFGGIYGGHYTATAKTVFKDKNYEWRLFDDYNVDNIDENSIVTPNAYTLFYRRTDCDIVKSD